MMRLNDERRLRLTPGSPGNSTNSRKPQSVAPAGPRRSLSVTEALAVNGRFGGLRGDDRGPCGFCDANSSDPWNHPDVLLYRARCLEEREHERLIDLDQQLLDEELEHQRAAEQEERAYVMELDAFERYQEEQQYFPPSSSSEMKSTSLQGPTTRVSTMLPRTRSRSS
jgi:hypothetical protein